MPGWRSRFRQRVLRRRLPHAIAQFPLECALTLWGFTVGAKALLGSPPSVALQELPNALETLWAILMVSAAIITLVGLVTRLASFLASGIQAFGLTMASFGCAVIAIGGFQRGGAVTGLLLLIGAVCLIRGWFLKEEENARVRESERKKAEEL